MFDIADILVSIGGTVGVIKFVLPIVENLLQRGHKEIQEKAGYRTAAAFAGQAIPGNKTEDGIADYLLATGANMKRHGNVKNPEEDALKTVKGVFDTGEKE